MKKAFSLSLALLMFLSALVSCSEQPGTETESTASLDTNISSDAAESETVNERLLIPDNLPEITFNGKTYRILRQGGFGDSNDHVSAEDYTGESVNDAVYSRNITIEDRFDVKIDSYVLDYPKVSSAVQQAVSASTSDYDTVYGHAVNEPKNIISNCYLNLLDLNHINFEQPWWNQSTLDHLTVNDVCFFAVGDSVMSSLAATYCVVYDKVAIENHFLEDPYTVVKEGRWTVDYLKKTAEQVAKDTDGDGNIDYFGFSTYNGTPANSLIWAFGLKVYEKNTNNEMQYTFNSERTVDCMTALLDLFLGANKGINTDSSIGGFIEQKSLFSHYLLSQLLNLGDYENTYGVIPPPKYDEYQDNYFTIADGAHSIIGVPNVPIDSEFVGIMIEAMCAETYKLVTPTYLDVCLKTRYSSSPEDAEMIDLCVRNCVFDFGYIFDGFNGVSFLPETMIRNKKMDFISYYKKFEKLALNQYNKMLDVFYNYAD